MRERRTFLALVHPPQQGLLEGFSSGLVALANYVTKKLPEVEVTLLDFGLLPDGEMQKQAMEYLQGVDGQVFVGVSSTTASYQSALRVVRAFKALCPGCVSILGGHHASAQCGTVLRTHHSVDYVVFGEGERPLLEFLRCFPDVSTVLGLAFRVGLDVHVNDPCPPLDASELDDIGPTFNGVGSRSAPGKFDHTTYVSARGCPLRCAFCAVSNEPIRCKSVDAAIRDLRVLVGDLGYTSIAIEDNHFARPASRTMELCSAIERLQQEMTFRWDCQTRVESCRPDVLEAMERAGCEAVYIGVEALDPEQLLYLRKTKAPGDYIRSLRKQVVPWLLRSKMDCYINIQMGLPAEGDSHRDNTLGILRQLGQQALDFDKRIVIFPQLHVVYPGTRHHNEAVMEGRFGSASKDIFERFTAWEARQQPVLRWLGEHFAHGTGGIPEGILYPDRLRRGGFEVNPDVVLEIINYLGAIRQTPGIRVFNYTKYLAGTHQHRDLPKRREKGRDGTVLERP